MIEWDKDKYFAEWQAERCREGKCQSDSIKDGSADYVSSVERIDAKTPPRMWQNISINSRIMNISRELEKKISSSERRSRNFKLAFICIINKAA